MSNFRIAELTEGQDLIVFDGECILCSGFFQFMVTRDRRQRFRYASAQSPVGQRLYQQLGLPTGDFETNLVIIGERVHQRLDAFAAAMKTLPGLWPVLSLCRFLPGFVKDPLYHAIARNRYRLFGRAEACLIPDAGLRSRFLPEGF
ncbi:thiol-disulfide oxidoreductase DCC family protein [Ruegeria sp.]|uniref:thiol-disulfide oxidoreductase DCC family protein n=1 Tax=Ruegeria sp. TaxID=1879320 RepID=UPI003B58C1B4